MLHVTVNHEIVCFSKCQLFTSAGKVDGVAGDEGSL